MGRLLREEDVIKAMEDNSVMVEVFGKKRKMIDAMMMCCDIADMPIAYDVEAVIQKLKENAFSDYEEKYVDNGECIIYLADAIEIVKGGVKND